MLNSFTRKSVWLIATLFSGVWQGGQGAWGQDASPTAAPQASAVHIVQIQRRSEGPEHTVSFQNTNDEVHAGESVEVKFDKVLGKAHVKIDADKEWALLQKTSRDTVWKLLIPARLSAANVPASVHTFSFYGSLGSDPSDHVFCGSRAIAVYPAPDAHVAGIEQRVINPKTSDVEYLTVSGDGFFAPLDQIQLKIGGKPAINKGVSADGRHLYAEFNPEGMTGTQPVRLEVWDTFAAFKDVSAEQIQIARYADELTSLGIAGGVFLLMAWLVLALARQRVKLRLPRILERILLEKQNNTYSLSCFQFYWWGGIILLAWLFVFAARGFLANDWRFPGLAGFATTLLISLGTLAGAQAVNAAHGPKGSGTVHPSLSDLITQGGVVAPERVQYFVWTVLSGIAYILIIIKSYQTAAALPVIPNELLVIMGISSLGYVAGKFARNPGPIITQITTTTSRDIVVRGMKLSVRPRIWLNGTELSPVAMEPLQFDVRQSNAFATAIHVSLPVSPIFAWHNPASPGDLRTLRLMNEDGQASDWSGMAPPPEQVTEWVNDPPLEPVEYEYIDPLAHLAPAAPVIISTPPEKILRVVYEQRSDAETEPGSAVASEQNGTPTGSKPESGRQGAEESLPEKWV